ncbi:hypothetical protein DSO57_1036066 [Entomophthora muscae]|uniref:Uncharacterized protein n=1 Tax=Entomophthora muscae TaxID=34485 RepID=A0ACC2U8E3_9FUNG|nr:hypothetical protein DSO57_1036066 [Entomophthora muscae]
MPPKPKQLIPADLKVVELRKELSARGLPTKGLKKDLVARLEEALESNNDEQEVDIEDKSSAESHTDLRKQEHPTSDDSPNNDSAAKPEVTADSILSSESTLQSTTDAQEKLQDINISQITKSDTTSCAGQVCEINEKEHPHQDSTVEADRKTPETEAGAQILDEPSTSIQESSNTFAKDSPVSQGLLKPVESSDANTHPGLTTTPNIAETTDISQSSVTIPLTSDTSAPQTDSIFPAATAYTDDATCTLVKVQNASTIVEPEPNPEIHIQAPSFDTSLAPESVSEALLSQNNSFAASSPNQVQEPQSSLTYHTPEVPKQVTEAVTTQDSQPQTNYSISERFHTSTTESFSMGKVTVNIASECQVTSEVVPNHNTPQAAAGGDEMDSLELNNTNPLGTSKMMDTDDHHPDEMCIDTDVAKPLDEKLPGAESHLATLPISPLNGAKVERSSSPQGSLQAAAVDAKMNPSELNGHIPMASSSAIDTDHSERSMDTGVVIPLDEKMPGPEIHLSTFSISPTNGNKVGGSTSSQEPSHIEKHSPVPTDSQPQPMNSLSSHEKSPRAEEEAVFSPSPMPQEEQAYSINADGKPLKFVAITNLTRPFPLSDFEEQLREYGPMDVFWIDKFRSHCYVQYETSAGAIQCQSMLAGVQFPPETGKKLDVVLLDEAEGQLLLQKEKASSERFILSIEENKPQLTLYSESRRASVRSAPPTRHASLHEQDSPKQDLPAIQLDEHFCKTSTIPPLYYKPTKELDTSSPEGAAQKRSREASFSDDAHSEANSGSPTLKQARID